MQEEIDRGIAMSGTDGQRAQWRRDAGVLVQLAGRWQDADATVQVPREIAERAVASWERTDEPSGGPREEETVEQAGERSAAGTLALIGAAIAERGRWDPDGVTVRVPLAVVGEVMAAPDPMVRS